MTRNWAEVNDFLNGAYKTGKQIKFKTAMRKSSLCDYSDECIIVIEAITNTKTEVGAVPQNADASSKQFTNSIS